MNKKGFTLIEMLVVIAIIAVLVAIVIPTVSNSTTKAGAAANAANLRSLLAEASTAYVSGGTDTDNFTFTKDASGKVTDIDVADTCTVKSKADGSFMTAGEDPVVTFDSATGDIEVTFGTGKTITYFSTIAETGAEPTT